MHQYTSTEGIERHVWQNTLWSEELLNALQYAITKLEGEELVRKAVREQNLDAVILNPCHIIGPWDTHNWIQLFEKVIDKSLPGIPPASGNFAWVGEVALAHIAAANQGRTGENYILGGPFSTMLAMIQEMQGQLNYPVSTKTTPAFLLKAMVPVFGLQRSAQSDSSAKRLVGKSHETRARHQPNPCKTRRPDRASRRRHWQSDRLPKRKRSGGEHADRFYLRQWRPGKLRS